MTTIEKWIPGEGSVSFEYIKRGTSYRFQKVIWTDQKQKITEIALSSVWVNDCPATYLKSFKGSQLPQNCSCSFIDGELHIKINDWNWYRQHKTDRGRELKITVTDNNGRSAQLTFFSTLRVLGVKQAIKRALLQGHNREYWHYLLFYKGWELDNHHTLEDCGIDNLAQLKIADPSEVVGSSSMLQMWTGGSLVTVKEFREYCAAINQKIGLICQIRQDEKKLGSGFLIGWDMVMTNAHLVPDDNELVSQTYQAYFFYHGGGEKPMPVACKALIWRSPSQNPPQEGKLDCAIILLKVDREQQEVLQHLNSIAESFFLAIGKRKIAYEERLKERANIIQHPLGDEKKVAFRENKILDPKQFELHYETTTFHGTSGSPVINDKGELIGLHRGECMKIELELHKQEHLEKLFEELNLGAFQYDDTKYFGFANAPHLEVFFKDSNKGKWWIFGVKPMRTITELIQEKKKFSDKEGDTKVQARQWAWDFLQRQGVKTIKKEHILCNTAVPAERLFEDLANVSKFQEAQKKPFNLDLLIRKVINFTFDFFQVFFTLKQAFAAGMVSGGLIVILLAYSPKKLFK
jgi:V8-like Glu-specific endopeptidase